MAARHELDRIPGIGPALKAKIEEHLSTGKIEYLEKLRSQVPAGIRDLMRLPGVGPKTARRFWMEIGVEGPQELSQAIEAGRLNGVAGFGERKIEQLRQGLAALGAGADGGARRPILDAWEIAEQLLRELRARAPVEQLVVAGSLRRSRETVGDLDLLATSHDPEKVLSTFVALPGVLEVRARGPTKSTLLHTPGIQVDLRVLEPASFGAALQYFTGSKDHNIRLRTIARDRGLRVNEYGVYRDTERIAGTTEEEVYASLGLPVIPPELREDRGEVEAAATGALPRLLDRSAVRGDPHVHLPSGGAGASLLPWADAARALGLSFLGIVVEEGGSAAGEFERLRSELESEPIRSSGVTFHLGIERPADSGLAPTNGCEFLLLRPTAAAPVGRARAERHRLPTRLGHLELEGPGSAHEGRDAWLARATKAGWPIEAGPRPERSSLDSGALRGLAGTGGRLFPSARAERPEELARIAVSLGLLRRGGIDSEQIVADWPSPPAAPPARRAR